MIVKIMKLSRSDKVSSKGNAYTSVGLLTTQYPNKWINGFGNKENAIWKAGDEVEIEVITKGQYLNFEMPKKESEIEKRVKKLEEQVAMLLGLKNDLNE